MARLFMTGGEAQDLTPNAGGPFVDGIKAGSINTFDTGTVRSGARSFKFDAGAGNSIGHAKAELSCVTGRSYFFRCYVNIPANPSAQVQIMEIDNNTHLAFTVKLTTSGTLLLWDEVAGVQVGSASAALALNTWHLVELRTLIGTGAIDEGELRLNGAQVAVTTTANVGNIAPFSFRWGWIQAPGANKVIYFDDVAINDDQGTNQNTWPGEGKVVLLLPISDNARDTLWTGGSGGTTNLFDAVDNTPPTGTATETNTTQIEHAGGAAGTTDRYDANMTTYATAGIASGDTINAIYFIEVDGEDIATGSKLLNFEVLSNPAIASPGDVTAGDNVGALATYPLNWVARRSSPVYNPSVTVGTSPVMRVRRPETASRVASVCFMGMYVDYTPSAAGPLDDMGMSGFFGVST